ncbi:MAG: hypothetical protein Q9157_004090 [Trypethelium eluteriae]
MDRNRSPQLEESFSTSHQPQRNSPSIRHNPGAPHLYPAFRPSPLRHVTNSDELESDSSQRMKRQTKVQRQEVDTCESQGVQGESSGKDEAKEQRKDSKVEGLEEQQEEGESGDSSETVRPPKSPGRNQDTDSDDSDSNETEPSTESRPQSALGYYTDTDEHLGADFARLDGDWTAPAESTLGQGQLTEENLRTFLTQVAHEDRGAGSSTSKRLGPSGEAPAPGAWFRRAQAGPVGISERSSDNPRPSLTTGIDEHASPEGVVEAATRVTEVEPSTEPLDPGVWFRSARSRRSSSEGTTSSLERPKRSSPRPRRDSMDLGEPPIESRKGSANADDPGEGSSRGPQQNPALSSPGGQPEDVARAALNRFSSATRQLSAQHRYGSHEQQRANEEAQNRAMQNALNLQRELHEDSESVEDEDDDFSDSDLEASGNDLSFERRKFQLSREHRQSSSAATSSPSRSQPPKFQIRRRRRNSDLRRESEPLRQSGGGPDGFPSMEQVWRHVGLGPSVDELMQTGRWEIMAAQWDSLQGYDVMWEFKKRWDRLLEDGNEVPFDEFVNLWKSTLRQASGVDEGEKVEEEKERCERDYSAVQTRTRHLRPRRVSVRVPPQENPDYRNENPYQTAESVYLEQDFRDAVIRMPGINPDTNDWTRQFFETHVFYWQRLVESPSPGSPRAPLAVGFEATEGLSRPEKTEETEEYGPGDRKGKKPADRNLRGGFDTACSIYPLRRNPRRIRLLNSRRNSRKVRNYRLSTMNNYFNSSDMANSVPRQAPSPGPQHQTNGIGGNSIASLNNSVLPAGQQADMNHLWGVVEQLSQILADNRAQTANIVNSVQQIQRCTLRTQSVLPAPPSSSPNSPRSSRNSKTRMHRYSIRMPPYLPSLPHTKPSSTPISCPSSDAMHTPTRSPLPPYMPIIRDYLKMSASKT